MAAAPILVLDRPEAAASVLNPERLRILEHLREPDSASGLSRRLDVPRQKINYHLRELEANGIVEFVEERRKGNCMERILRAKADSFLISPDTLGSVAPQTQNIADRFSAAYLLARAAQTIRDLTGLRRRADEAGKTLATLTVESEIRFRSAAERKQFTEELTATLAQLAAKYNDDHAPGGRRFQFFFAGYPGTHKEK